MESGPRLLAHRLEANDDIFLLGDDSDIMLARALLEKGPGSATEGTGSGGTGSTGTGSTGTGSAGPVPKGTDLM